jgi:CubicO group peptidase (beta-lactamase class C family)
MATIMSVVEEGLMNLDDKVTKYYPNEFKNSPINQISLLNMMTHTSGYDNEDVWTMSATINL